MSTNSYRTVGSGERKVIVLHGWFGDAASWAPILDLLDTDTFSYAFVDYRGYGEALDQSGEFTIEEIASDALEIADELGWQRFSLVGHSMGGKAIQRVLADVPDRVERMVGISPVPPGPVPFDDDGWALFSGAADEAGNRRAILDLTTGNRLSGRWLDAMTSYSLEHSARDAFAAYLPAWAKTDFQSEIDQNPVPFSLIVGAHDPAIGEDTMRGAVLPSYPNASLQVLPDAGHYAMNEAPVRLVTLMEEFLHG